MQSPVRENRYNEDIFIVGSGFSMEPAGPTCLKKLLFWAGMFTLQSPQSCSEFCKVLVRETGDVQELFCFQSSTQAGEEQGRGTSIVGMLDMDQREKITQK